MGLTKNKNMSKSKTKSNIKTKTKKRCNKSRKNGIVSIKNMRGGQKSNVKPVNTGEKKPRWFHKALSKVGYTTATMKTHQAQQAEKQTREAEEALQTYKNKHKQFSTYNKTSVNNIDPVKLAAHEAQQKIILEKKLQKLIEGKTELQIKEELNILRQPLNPQKHIISNAEKIAHRRVRSGMVPITQSIKPEQIKDRKNNDNLLGPLQSNIRRLREEAKVKEIQKQINYLENTRKPLNISTLTDQEKADNLKIKQQRVQNDINQAKADAMQKQYLSNNPLWVKTLANRSTETGIGNTETYNNTKSYDTIISNKQKTELEKSNSYKKYMNDFKQKKAEEKAQSIIKFLKEKGTKNSQPRSKRITPDIIAEIIRIKSENTGNLTPEQIETQKKEIANLFVTKVNGRLKGIFDKNMVEEISKHFSESSINNVETILKSSKQEETSNQSSII